MNLAHCDFLHLFVFFGEQVFANLAPKVFDTVLGEIRLHPRMATEIVQGTAKVRLSGKLS